MTKLAQFPVRTLAAVVLTRLTACAGEVVVVDDDGGAASADSGGSGGGVPDDFSPQTCEELCQAWTKQGCDNCQCNGPHPDYPCPEEERAAWKCAIKQIHPGNCVAVCPEEGAAVDACEAAHKDD